MNKYKEKYYNTDRFEKSFLNLLQNSRNYLENKITNESKEIKDVIINKYNTLEKN